MWTKAKAPSLAEMEVMAHEIFERLPKDFRALCEGVIVRVDDFPADEVLDEMKAQSEFDLLGLFQGIGLPFRSNDDIARLPNMVWLYRRTDPGLLGRTRGTLGHIVRHVLIHGSATISGFPTPTWRRSRRRPIRVICQAICPLMPGVFAINTRQS
jgi:predicted Zn-dependent protease with MMP-like domain